MTNQTTPTGKNTTSIRLKLQSTGITAHCTCLSLTALALVAITGCRDEQKIKADQDSLVLTSLENLVTVKGGSFQMGDFGRLIDEHLPFNPDQDTPFIPSHCQTFVSENTASPGGSLTAGCQYKAGGELSTINKLWMIKTRTFSLIKSGLAIIILPVSSGRTPATTASGWVKTVIAI